MGAGCSSSLRTAPEPPAHGKGAGHEDSELFLCTADTPAHADVFWCSETLLAALDSLPRYVNRARSSPLLGAVPLPTSPARASTLEWQFDLFSVPYAELPVVAYGALMSHPELSAPASKIDTPKLWRFVCELARYYRPRPFHSFRHAVDVLLASSSLLRLVRHDRPDGVDDPLVVGALLVAALMHDITHPACMNGLLVATGHPLAAESTTACLERFHVAVGLALLERPELDFLGNLEPAARARFLATVTEIVHATDVTTTMPAAKEFRALVEAGGTPSCTQLVTLLIKAADISNPARPLPVYEQWISGVMEEFFTQGDVERAKGLPLSMNCDRETVVVSKCQVGFISFLVGPLYAALAAYAPALRPLLDTLETNKSHFAGLGA